MFFEALVPDTGILFPLEEVKDFGAEVERFTFEPARRLAAAALFRWTLAFGALTVELVGAPARGGVPFEVGAAARGFVAFVAFGGAAARGLYTFVRVGDDR